MSTKSSTLTNTNMSMTPSDVVYQEIQDILGRYFWGISVLSLSPLERSPLEYHSVGVNCIKELLDKMRDKGIVLFFEEPKSKQLYVMCARTVKISQYFLKLNVQELLDDRGGSILLNDFEDAYKYKFKEKLDYHHFCLKDFDNLCSVLNLVVEVTCSGELVLKAGNNLRYMPTNTSDVYREIQKLIGMYSWGIPESSLSNLESKYRYVCKRSLDYNSLGVNNIEELVYKMRDESMVVFSEEPESKRTYVMCPLLLKDRHAKLKLKVQNLLDENDGEIPLIDFEVTFEKKFVVPLDYFYYGLKDIYSLCEVLNLVVEAEHSRGEVMKRKRSTI